MTSEVIYEDKWGEIIDRPLSGLIEIRWFDTTSTMKGDEFNNWLSVFAGCVEAKKRSGCLVDSVQFKMPMDRINPGWRDANIIPRYNAAGVKRFAFVVPAGMPLIGAKPKQEGPGNFPTGYFGERAKAVAWIESNAA